MSTIVLVHGMWHGAWCWQRLTPLLQEAGHSVFAPTLSGLGERAHLREEIGWQTHVGDVVATLEDNDLEDAQLIGHSYGGALILNVAERVPGRIGQLICLDAPIPRHGQRYRDVMPNFYATLRQLADASGDPEWAKAPADWTFGIDDAADLEWLRARLTPHPLATFETPLAFGNPAALALPKAFIACTAGDDVDRVAARKHKWTERGWRFRALATGHDAMLTDPAGLAVILQELIPRRHDEN